MLAERLGLPDLGSSRPFAFALAINAFGSGLFLPFSLRYFHHVGGLSLTQAGLGLSIAMLMAVQKVLDAGTGIPSRVEYHRAILQALGVHRPAPKLLEELDQPTARPPVEPFPEVPTVLERLRAAGVGMAVVSDNWPGLEDLYRRLGLDTYFQAFVISAVLGCRKPDPRMYQAGSDALGLAPHECLFVDDAPDLVAAAIQLGYGGTAIIRTAGPPTGVPWISTWRT